MSAKVIAIDGFSYVGKSTIAKTLADLMGFTYINTGHMFRSVAKMCIDQGVAPENRKAVLKTTESIDFCFSNARGSYQTIINGEDWTASLDDYSIVLAASKIAVIPQVRDILAAKQREYARDEMIVIEGRDIGSVVFPDALWKFFITASIEVRAKRMYKMMDAKQRHGVKDFRELMPKVKALDDSDLHRPVAPLKMADDAILYDNSDSPDERQDALILQYYITHADEIARNAGRLAARKR